MTSTLTIKLTNASKVAKEFYLFAEKPQIDSGMEGIYQAYFLKYSAGPGGDVSFTFTDEIFAVCGRSQVSENATLEQKNSTGPVSLKKPHVDSIQCIVTKVSAGVADPPMSFEDKSGTPDNNPGSYPDGSFIIKTYSGFSQGDPFFVGIGKKDPSSGEIIPVAVKTPSPNSEHIIQPVRKFYVAWGSYQPGVLANIMVTNKATEIDFTGGKVTASLTYQPDGMYSQVSYN